MIDLPALVEACTDQCYNQTLGKVDEAVVRLGVVHGEYHWHHHEHEDEFFVSLMVERTGIIPTGVAAP